jgi:hypothetical protein
MATLGSAFPQDFRTLAAQLGIDFTKPAEVFQYNREASGLHYYGGYFHLVGRILFEPRKSRGKSSPTQFDKLKSGFEFVLGEASMPVTEPFKGNALVELNFAMRIPWVLSEPDPDEGVEA